jgi:leader peptidase (prepilin peptidase)/N-methyltransferase
MMLGYGAGCLVAALLDRCYSGAPFLGRLESNGQRGGGWRHWTGTLGYALVKCGARPGGALPARYCYAPLIGMGAGWLIAVRVTDARQAALAAVFALVLLALTVADFERHLLPNRLMYPSLLAALLLAGAWPARNVTDTLSGGLLAVAVMLAIFLLSPGFGFGDVKLGLLLGLLTGLSNVGTALVIGIGGAGIGAVVLLLSRRATLRSTMAYGPYLALGALAGMLTG